MAIKGDIASILDKNMSFNDIKDKFKPQFIERYKSLLQDRYEEFINYSLAYINKAIRINPLKTTISQVLNSLSDEWTVQQIPWTKYGFWIRHKDKFDIGNLPQHQLGWIYIQEAASMIPVEVLQPKKNSIILDACASPGSKTGQIAGMINDEGVIIANDLDYKRTIPLATNLERLGVRNVIITNIDATRIDKNISEIDYALVDAPCSGTGTIRKSLKVLDMWSPQLVKKMSMIQKRIISSVLKTLKPGGVMVYSTCTMEAEEDEGVISWLIENFDVKILPIEINIKRSPSITYFNGEEYNKEVKKTLRIWPMDNNTEGFFVAKIMKK